jgi:hypothetical protein
LIHLSLNKKKVGYGASNRALVPVLVPMFLIISSSVYPAIMSSEENKEAQISSKVMGELQQNDNVASRRYQAHLGMIDTSDFIPSSPAPADPILSATFSDNDETSGDNTSPTIQQQKDDGIYSVDKF